jgi:hypothetical protein
MDDCWFCDDNREDATPPGGWLVETDGWRAGHVPGGWGPHPQRSPCQSFRHELGAATPVTGRPTFAW